MVDAVSCQIQQYIFFAGICRCDMLFRNALYISGFHTTVHTMAINHSMVQQPPVKNKLEFIIKDFCDEIYCLTSLDAFQGFLLR